MNKKTFITLMLALVAMMGQAQTKDSLLLFVQAGDSCMQQYNTFEALKYYQKAYAIAKNRGQQSAEEQPDIPLDKFDELPEEKQDEIIEQLKQSAENSSKVDCMVQMKLANCHYKRGNYRETADLLKLVPEDSLSHDAFRQLCFSYQKQGDNDSFIYWASQLNYRYPMDGEVVANLILANIKAQQPQGGIFYGLQYSQRASTNILANNLQAIFDFASYHLFSQCPMSCQRRQAMSHSEFLLATPVPPLPSPCKPAGCSLLLVTVSPIPGTRFTDSTLTTVP